MQCLEIINNARIDRLEQRLQAKERPEVRRRVVREPKQEEESNQNRSNFDRIIDESRRGEQHGSRGTGGFQNRRLQGRRENNSRDQVFEKKKLNF